MATTRETPTRTALLDAAYDAVVAGDWRTTRMADVAAAAGVSRQTLYNEFGSKDALAQALALREATRFIEGTEAALDEARPKGPVEAIAAATVWTLTQAADNPLLKASLTDDTGGLMPYLTTRGQPLLAAARESVSSYLLVHWPALDTRDVDIVADAVSRLTVSYLVLPSDASDASPDAIADRLVHLIRPLLEDR